MSDNKKVEMSEIVELCKRRGILFQSAEIYGGLQGIYDYGPLGVEIKRNLKNTWWKSNIYMRDDIEGIDASILTHKKVLKYSGHEDTFTDPLVDCKECKNRMRADHLNNNQCSFCGSKDLTSPRNFNLMFKCGFGPVENDDEFVYLRPETAQSIFINFNNVLNTTHRNLPFGIAQIGKAFRNEITARNFIFRTREFEQMEIEFFVDPKTSEKWFNYWIKERINWWKEQGIKEENLKIDYTPQNQLAHYSLATADIMYKFPHGFDELEGIANRSDFDLASHSKNNTELTHTSDVKPNTDSNVINAIIKSKDEKLIPYVIEPSAGVDRGVLAILTEAFCKELLEDGKSRIVLKLPHHISPYKLAIIPLAKNNEQIMAKSKEIFKELINIGNGNIKLEMTGNIGKSYRRHDEIGTPFCITVDFETFEAKEESITIRDRDSMKQKRVKISEFLDMFKFNSLKEMKF